MASYDELARCAAWYGGRIPTLEEGRSIYEYVDELKGKEIEKALGKTIPAVNRYLALPSFLGRTPTDLFKPPHQ